MIAKWEVLDRRPAADFGLFKVHRQQARSPRTGRVNSVLSIDFPDWVLVVALTPAQEIVMVRQYRHGNAAICLELPGGLVDPEDASPAEAAGRELLEETGYRTRRMVELGKCFPQPAILTNRCFFYLAADATRQRPPAPDEGEDIEVVTLPLGQVTALLQEGKLVNGMTQLALYHYLAFAGRERA